jgi:hypothetical protein
VVSQDDARDEERKQEDETERRASKIGQEVPSVVGKSCGRKGGGGENLRERERFREPNPAHSLPSSSLPIRRECFISPLPNHKAAEENKSDEK